MAVTNGRDDAVVVRRGIEAVVKVEWINTDGLWELLDDRAALYGGGLSEIVEELRARLDPKIETMSFGSGETHAVDKWGKTYAVDKWYGEVADFGGGQFRVQVERDTPHYPAVGTRVVVQAWPVKQ